MRLGRVLHKWRVSSELDMRTVAKYFGISAATLMRIEEGKDFDAATLVKIMGWLCEDDGVMSNREARKLLKKD